MHNLERLLGQVDLLRNLSHQPISAKWAYEAIIDATREIERVAEDDVAADYAREIRGELLHLATGSAIPDAALVGSAVDESIARLGRYLEMQKRGAEPGHQPRL